jgi:predicted nucleotidyltransferase
MTSLCLESAAEEAALRCVFVSEELSPVLTALKDALGERLVAVVLFGSQARGEAEKTSDWDLLLIARDLPAGSLKRHLTLKRALPPLWRGRIALLAKTPEEFEVRLPALYLDIAHDGIILYDPTGYAAQKLARIRQLRLEAGLERREWAGELIWDWTRPPTGPWKIEWDGVDGIPT